MSRLLNIMDEKGILMLYQEMSISLIIAKEGSKKSYRNRIIGMMMMIMMGLSGH